MEPTIATDALPQTPLEDVFPEACWSTIARDRGSASFRDLLGRIVERYSVAIRAYLRVAAPERRRDLDDLEQTFYALVLHRPVLEGYRADRGRFGQYLKGVLRHFLAEERRRERALRRRASTTVPLSAGHADDVEDRHSGRAESVIDRRFLETTVRSAITRLEERLRIEGKSRAYIVFSSLDLEGADRPPTYAELALRLGIAHHDVKNDLVLARKRFDEVLLGVVAETTGSRSLARAELEELLRA